MGKHKKHKYAKRKDKVSESPRKIPGDSEQHNTGKKRSFVKGVENGGEFQTDLTASPRSKSRKTVEVTLVNDQNG